MLEPSPDSPFSETPRILAADRQFFTCLEIFVLAIPEQIKKDIT